MRQFSTRATICVLLVLAGTLSAFGLSYNASRSNTGNIILAYSPGRVTQSQVATILAELEKLDAAPDEATLRQILKKQGVDGDGVQKIVKTGMIGDPRTRAKSFCFLLLEKPEDQAVAFQASQHPVSAPSKK